MERAILLTVVLTLVGTAVVAAPPATRPVDPLDVSRAKERAGLIRQYLALPTLPDVRSADAFALDVDDGHVRLRTRLAPPAGTSRLHLTDLPGDWTVTAGGPPAAAPPTVAEPYVPAALLLEQWQFDRPGAAVTDTTVERLPNGILLSRTSESPAGDRHVAYLERLIDGEGPAVVLRGDGGPGSPGQVVVTADRFVTLRRLHPAEVATYLEPILRDLHIDAPLLAADPVLAYQVFAADAPADPVMDGKVSALVTALDADDFRTRDAAGEKLAALGPAAGVVIARLDRDKLSPEQRGRVAAVLAAFRPVFDVDAERLATDRDFLLNCLLDTDPFVVTAARSRLRRSVGHDVRFDDALRGDARREAVWTLRQQTAGEPTTRQSNVPVRARRVNSVHRQ